MRSRLSCLCTPGLALLGILLVLEGCAPSLEAVRPTRSMFLSEAPRRTLTVMPIALSMLAEERPGGSVTVLASTEAAGRAVPAIARATQKQVARGGWQFEELAWDGTAAIGGSDERQVMAARRQVIDAEGVANLTDWLFGYSDGVLRDNPSREPLPPVPLVTDATLFVGGHGYLHEDRPHRNKVAADVAVGIGIALIAVAIVAVIALLAAGGGRGGGLSFPKLPSFGGGGGRAVGAVVRAAVLPLELGARFAVPVTHASLAAGHTDGRGCNTYLGIHDGVAAPRVDVAQPVSSQARANTLALSAVLVENRTGRVLWSAGQVMAVDPVDSYEVRKAVEHLLADLPRSETVVAAATR